MFEFRTKDVWVGNRVMRFQIVDHPGAAAIWAVEDGNVLLVEQYRPAARRYMLEIPAGTLEIGEDPLQAAHREFEGETGYKAETMEFICHLYPTPGYTTEVLHVYHARGLSPGTQSLEQGEDLVVRWLPLERMDQLVEAGEINDAKTLVAYYRCRQECGGETV